MALVAAAEPHFHHLAFDYCDFGTLRALFDNLAQHGRWLAWGPVRHGIAQNICGYVRITEEPLLVECYVDMEQLEPDHEPRQWPDDGSRATPGGRCPHARISASTAPRSNRSARASRRAASRSRRSRDRPRAWRERAPRPPRARALDRRGRDSLGPRTGDADPDRERPRQPDRGDDRRARRGARLHARRVAPPPTGSARARRPGGRGK